MSIPVAEHGTCFVNAIFGRKSPAAKTAEARRFRHHAFSLVEVVLALGIISAVFIPLLGMLSVGFSTMKESNIDVRVSLIAQKCLASAQMVPFVNLQTATNYLSYEGTEVSKSEAAFIAVIEPVSAANLLGSANIKNVRVTVSGAGIQTNRPRVFSSTVANLGD